MKKLRYIVTICLIIAMCTGLAACSGAGSSGSSSDSSQADQVSQADAAGSDEQAESSEAETINEAEAVTMRLMKAEGDITLIDDTGSEVPVVEEMRLFSDNTIFTLESSRAGINLDDVKAVTLGELSSADISQHGKNLKMELTEGEMYFSVSEPLGDDESFEIETSTMTMGIRGTSGYVCSVREGKSVIILTSGSAVITMNDFEEYTIDAGHMVTVAADEDGDVEVIEDLDVIVGELPELIFDELNNDEEMYNRSFEESSSLSLDSAASRLNGEAYTDYKIYDDGTYSEYNFDEYNILASETWYDADGGFVQKQYDQGNPLNRQVSQYENFVSVDEYMTDSSTRHESSITISYTQGSTLVRITADGDDTYYQSGSVINGLNSDLDYEWEMQDPSNHLRISYKFDEKLEGWYVIEEIDIYGDVVARQNVIADIF